MPRNEEGEFELVLGNRQLLSVFFIVVVLLGVFFVMGYILGKNSAPAPATEVSSVRKPVDSGPAPEPIIVDKTPDKRSAAGEPVTKREEPKREEPKPVEARPVEPKKEEPKKEEPKKEEKKKREEPKVEAPAPSAASAGASKTGMPPKGSLFMQVAAVGRAEADVVAKVLKSKGMLTWVAPADETGKIYRVLVGPIEKSEVGATKANLVKMGFSPFPRAY